MRNTFLLTLTDFDTCTLMMSTIDHVIYKIICKNYSGISLPRTPSIESEILIHSKELMASSVPTNSKSMGSLQQILESHHKLGLR